MYSLSAINTGDFDIATGAQEAFEEELQRQGFRPPIPAGQGNTRLDASRIKAGV
jgi:hypothetical protein